MRGTERKHILKTKVFRFVFSCYLNSYTLSHRPEADEC